MALCIRPLSLYQVVNDTVWKSYIALPSCEITLYVSLYTLTSCAMSLHVREAFISLPSCEMDASYVRPTVYLFTKLRNCTVFETIISLPSCEMTLYVCKILFLTEF
jgi:hypothetical protein